MKRLSIPADARPRRRGGAARRRVRHDPAPHDEFTRIADAADALAVSGKALVMPAERLHALLTDADPRTIRS